MDFTEMIKETHIKRFYGGANGNKKAVDINGSIYMIKFPPKKENLKISYINSCISEYIGCKIFKSIGIPVQEVILGTIIEKGKKKIVVACKDFTSPGIILQDFAAIKNSCIDSSNNGYGVELSEIKEAIREQQAVPEETVTRRFWDMFVVDALIGNFDRHNGNWGFLINVLDNTVELAPVFDCGSSLLPQADDTVKLKYKNKEKEVAVSVKDTTKPEFNATATAGIETIEGVDLKFNELIKATDISGAEVTFDAAGVNLKKAGTYTLKATAVDKYDNRTAKDIKVTVKDKPANMTGSSVSVDSKTGKVTVNAKTYKAPSNTGKTYSSSSGSKSYSSSKKSGGKCGVCGRASSTSICSNCSKPSSGNIAGSGHTWESSGWEEWDGSW